MENGRIKNESLSASSSLNNNFLPSFARLHANILGGSWCSRIQNISQFFQLDLLEVHRVTEVHLQGLYDGPTDNWAWVTKYQLSYNTDNLTWTVHNESGNIVSKYKKHLTPFDYGFFEYFGRGGCPRPVTRCRQNS